MAKHTTPQETAPTLEVIKQFPTREQVISGFPEREGYEVVDSPLPFAERLTAFVLLRDINLSSASQPYVQAYRGWDFNRRGDNLLTKPEYGTGFEGYGVGRYAKGEDMILEIAQRGKDEIDFIKRLYPDVYRTVLKEIWDALAGRRVTSRALETLQGIWISNLHRYQEEIRGNRVAESFRDNTKLTVASASRVGFYYEPKGKIIHCVYYRPKARRGLAGVQIERCGKDPEKLLAGDPGLVDGWRLMSEVGKLGQMAVRAAGEHGFLRGSITEAVRSDNGMR